MELITLLVEDNMDGERLDFFISEQIDDISRTMIKNIIDEKKVKVNGESKKASYKVNIGDEIIVELEEPREVDIIPQNIPLDIIYQDSDIVVINKPKNMVVHPAHGNWDNTLVNALLYHIKDLSGINGEIRPGIVHRLDKDTSGVMVVAKHDTAHRNIALQIKNHTINREYIALVHGIIKENLGTIDAPIGRSKKDRKKMAVIGEGKEALSNYEVLNRYKDYTLLKVKLLTGRTHQIRVHFSYIKHPVVGDPLYSSGKNPFGLESQALHAHLLGFNHPSTDKYVEFKSELPDDLKCILESLVNK
ncbi:Hypothetical protein SYNTR_1079 [Candidatus Syntrophocurvum alkaliphilum]|uniref:Pseudouridine synthase n=1 Tax=Candidatus Syntrophocurvum alkaliphilum TaxID=2293317 RepID=A0A6I6DFC9_9FIRM|nr:RluA family pseudouridine synthase [Candidatus Syntrophocurvum alkaliphilum]QGT99672.1 Hypothetical protein SYNTR_1079 [Candidatus Syntrophocurvum alkaliphilum]